MNELKSHPHLTLAEHIGQVRQAAQAIWHRHTPALRDQCAQVWQWIDDAVSFHDVGNASQAFQNYIKNPKTFKGDPRRKAHTPFSMVYVLEHARVHGWDWHRALSVAAITAGHHGEFKSADQLKGVVDDCATTDIPAILDEQLRSVDWLALDRAIGVTAVRLDNIEGLEVCVYSIGRLKKLFRQLQKHPDLLHYHLLCQLAYSVLLEADKAYLAVAPEDIERYLHREPTLLPASLVDDFLAKKESTALNNLRTQARVAMLSGMEQAGDLPLQTMTLPTGTGKTLLAATWALKRREDFSFAGYPPRIVVVLPYLAIIDQTVKEYQALFAGTVQAGDLLSYHSLSERVYDTELESESNEFFLDTWQADVIVTTFDQFLFALLSPKSKHQMRFHHLTDALVVLDEIQTLPCRLWEPVNQVLQELVRLGRTQILAMTATQPSFLRSVNTQFPIRELIGESQQFFQNMKRYHFMFRYQADMGLSRFIDECKERMHQWTNQRTLITLNTRRSARTVRLELEQQAKQFGLPLYFLSGEVTPKDRLEVINENVKDKARSPCLVVSTQCIEAGVDIDMDLVIRDFGPLDSLIQIAGRCNRHGRPIRGTIEIVSLFDDTAESEQSRRFASQIYDKILLQATREVLAKYESLVEEEVYPVVTDYFHKLRTEKDLGQDIIEAWARWEEIDAVRHLLRGKQPPQVTFIVTEQDPQLRAELEEALSIEDRWKRRQAVRSLAFRIAQISVAVYVPRDEAPEHFASRFAEPLKWFWLLNPGYYQAGRGLLLTQELEEQSWHTMIA